MDPPPQPTKYITEEYTTSGIPIPMANILHGY